MITDADTDMEFGVFTFIIPDTIFNSIKKYIDYEFELDENSQILFTYDDAPDIIKEFDTKTDRKPKMEKTWYSSRHHQMFFQLEKHTTLFLKDVPEFLAESGLYRLKSLKEIFHKHIHWSNGKPSIYNCLYYVYEPTKKNAFSILKIGSNRYLFAYQPKYLNKTDLEQIVFDLFIGS
jgi:hypothetical protein